MILLVYTRTTIHTDSGETRVYQRGGHMACGLVDAHRFVILDLGCIYSENLILITLFLFFRGAAAPTGYQVAPPLDTDWVIVQEGLG